ncbi:MAG: hypothetical protein H7Y04_05130 [Verrucomicrobia bacterium]|nr:hypothetical protein [Cytophagales bacterium]
MLLTYFIRYWTFVGYWGVKPEMPEAEQKNIILCNQINWMLININLVYLVTDFIWVGSIWRSLTTIAIISFAGLCLWLTYHHITFFPRLMSAFAYSSFVFSYGIVNKFLIGTPLLIHYLSPRIPLIMFVFFPFMFLNFRKEKMAFFTTFIINVSYVLFYDPIHYLLGINMEKFGLHLDYYHVFTVNSITFLINISTGFAFLQQVNYSYEQKNRKLTKELIRKNNEIADQNMELLVQGEEITSLNQQLRSLLEFKDEKLNQKSQQVREYAFMNAHTLRSPIATILGLHQLLNLVEDEHEKEMILQKLKESVENLDKTVRKIQNVVAEDKKN